MLSVKVKGDKTGERWFKWQILCIFPLISEREETRVLLRYRAWGNFSKSSHKISDRDETRSQVLMLPGHHVIQQLPLQNFKERRPLTAFIQTAHFLSLQFICFPPLKEHPHLLPLDLSCPKQKCTTFGKPYSILQLPPITDSHLCLSAQHSSFNFSVCLCP